MERPMLAECEYRFMDLLWEREPVSSGALVELCLDRFQWKKSTTYTVLKRLGEKGVLRNENGEVRALVSREEVQTQASQHFVEQTFGGSLPGFLAAFLGGKAISDREAEELKRLIDESRED